MMSSWPVAIETRALNGRDDIALIADMAGPQGGQPVLLLHGGGQTRGSWKKGFMALAAAGYRAISLDARGHGESEWALDGDYRLAALVDDLRCVLLQIPPNPVLVGASMGGTTALALLGEPHPPAARALVLVDVAPTVDRKGISRVSEFMRSNVDGFGSIEAAVDAIVAFNPHRQRPADSSGLRRNLRERDGRLFWHWDPAFLGLLGIAGSVDGDRMKAIARQLNLPTLLIRGAQSEIVKDADVAEFRSLMPHSKFVDVAGAGHMIVGDQNDAFNNATLQFLDSLLSQAMPGSGRVGEGTVHSAG